MKAIDKLHFIDDLLIRLEDTAHGQEGKDITESRGYLVELIKK